jgi:hypothetical protein
MPVTPVTAAKKHRKRLPRPWQTQMSVENACHARDGLKKPSLGAVTGVTATKNLAAVDSQK